MTIKKTSLAILASTTLALSLSAREQIKIVGSSTVYPFSSAVAEELGAITKYPTPVVESTGSGGGMKIFCAGNGINTPDITNASRRIKLSELQMCHENGVKNISEMMIGFDGIAVAQSVTNKDLDIKKEFLALAVAKEVPSKDGKKLIANPYKKWSDIDSSLPNREIIVYGPPKSSGTRDSFEELVLQAVFKKMPVYTKKHKKYSQIRTDGAYVDSGENDNLIVQKITKNKAAIGIFGYSFLEENSDIVKGSKISSVEPTAENISNGNYPISRSMFFYTKNSHYEKVPAMQEYVNLFISENMIGKGGILSEIGLISLPDELKNKYVESMKNKKTLTFDDLKKH